MSQQDIILRMKNITKTFGPVTALSEFTMYLLKVEIHDICG